MTLLRCTMAVFAVQLSASVAGAQTTTNDAVQVTPFISMDSRGSTPVGGAISFPVTSIFDLEAEVTYQDSALSTHASLLYDLPRIGRTRPYLAAGVGLAQVRAPVFGLGGSPVGSVFPIALEVNAGGGLKVPVADTWGMRTDARWFKSFGRHGSEHFRVAQGISFDVKR